MGCAGSKEMGEGKEQGGKKRKEGPGNRGGKKGGTSSGPKAESGKGSAGDRKKGDAQPPAASSSGRGKENATPASDNEGTPSLESKSGRSDPKAGRTAGAAGAGAGAGAAVAGAGAAAAAAAAALAASGSEKKKEGQASAEGASGEGASSEGAIRNSRRKSFSPDGKETAMAASGSNEDGELGPGTSPFEKEPQGEGPPVGNAEAHPERPLFTGPIQPPSPPVAPSIVEVPGTGTWLRYSWLTQRGYYPEAPGKANQDSFCVVPQYGGEPGDFLFGVYDGHGEHGTPCSQFSRDRLAENLLKHPLMKTDVATAFRDAFVDTNVELHQSTIDDTMSGSTGIAVLLRNSTLYAANVGDSRAVLAQWVGPSAGADGGAREGEERLVAVDLSSDQTPFRADECERVKACGARVLTLDQLEGLKDPNVQCWGGEEDDDGDPPRLWVQSGMYPGTAFTRSVGDSVAEKIGVSAEPEIMAVDVSPHSHPFFVIASDGVFEFLSSQDVVDMVAQHNDPHAACAQVVAESYRLWLQYETRTDDITIIVVHLDDHPPPALQASTRGGAGFLPLAGAGLLQRSMLSDMAVFHRRAIEGSDLDFTPALDPALDVLPEKDTGDQERLVMAIRSNFLFHMLPEDELGLVLRAFEARDLVPGDVIIQQGEEGDRFFVCDRGDFDVLVETGQDEDPLGTVVHRYVADAAHAPSFGDLALMYGTRREASVRAASEGRIWALRRSLFRSIQTRPVAQDQQQHSPASTRLLRALRATPALAPLSFGQLQRLAFFMRLLQLQAGQEMTLEADCVYIFYEGEVVEIDQDGNPLGPVRGHEPPFGNGSTGGGGLGATGGVGGGLDGGAGVVGGAPLNLMLSLRRGERGAVGSGRSGGAHSFQEGVLSGGGGGGGVCCVRALGDAVGRFISCAEFEGAVGSLAALEEADAQLHSLQTGLQEQRLQSGRQKAMDDIASTEVEWVDTLSSTEWSQVGQVRIPRLGETLSMKRFGKGAVPKAGRETQVLRERVLLQTAAANPFVPPVIAPVLDPSHVGLLLDCHLAVPLALLLGEPLPEECAQFVAASLVLALQLLHRDGLVFRAVAPATIFLDSQALVQLPDFRFSKHLNDGRTFTLCGYPDFVAPEMISGMGHGQAADWWALGVLVYAMLQGEGPFGSWKDSELQVYTRIARRSMDYPDHFSAEAVSLVDQLLAFNPEDRLGCGVGGAEAVKDHPWFKGVPWAAIARRQCAPPDFLRARVAELQEQRGMMMEGQKELEQQQQEHLEPPEASAGGGASLAEDASPWFEGW